MGIKSWFLPKNPQTGNGRNKPAGQSLPPKIQVVQRDSSGKKLPKPKKK
jgi:hypothetical protein